MCAVGAVVCISFSAYSGPPDSGSTEEPVDPPPNTGPGPVEETIDYLECVIRRLLGLECDED